MRDETREQHLLQGSAPTARGPKRLTSHYRVLVYMYDLG